jgi:hypothetical protein
MEGRLTVLLPCMNCLLKHVIGGKIEVTGKTRKKTSAATG